MPRIRIRENDDGDEVDLNRRFELLERRLRIDPNALERVCVEHPDSIYNVTSAVTLIRSRRDAKKKELEEEEARLYLHIRRQASVQDERITEAEVKAQMVLDPARRRLVENLAHHNELLARWEALRDAFAQRSYMIKELVSLYLARYYGDPARSAENRMREVSGERVREQRRERNRREEYN